MNFGATKLNWAKTEKYPNSTMTYDHAKLSKNFEIMKGLSEICPSGPNTKGS